MISPGFNMAVDTKRDQERADAYVERDPDHAGRANAWIRGRGVHVWVIIGHLKATDWDRADTMRAYALTAEMIQAAEAYYRLNREHIEAKLLLESDYD
jgi:uncharacterized protein (DUF433 family)